MNSDSNIQKFCDRKALETIPMGIPFFVSIDGEWKICIRESLVKEMDCFGNTVHLPFGSICYEIVCTPQDYWRVWPGSYFLHGGLLCSKVDNSTFEHLDYHIKDSGLPGFPESVLVLDYRLQ